MEKALDEYPLEAIGQEHLIAVGMFVPFAIACLHRDPERTEAQARVRLRGIGGQREEQRSLLLF